MNLKSGKQKKILLLSFLLIFLGLNVYLFLKIWYWNTDFIIQEIVVFGLLTILFFYFIIYFLFFFQTKFPLPKTAFRFNSLNQILNAQKTILLIFEPKTQEIVWTNDSNFFVDFFRLKKYYQLPLKTFLPEEILFKIQEKKEILNERIFFKHKKTRIQERFLISVFDDNLLVLQKQNELSTLENFFVKNQIIFLLMEIDASDFILDPDNLLEQKSPQILAFIDSKLDEVLNDFDGWLTSTKPGSFVMLLSNANFQILKKDKFNFMKKISDDIYKEFKIRLTFSGGVFDNYSNFWSMDKKNFSLSKFSLSDNYQRSLRALKMSKSRLGDQITLIDAVGNFRFFGEQKIAQVLPVRNLDKEYLRFLALINKYDNIFIVGHKNADFDVYGAGLGLKFFLESIFGNRKKVHFVVQKVDIDVKTAVEENLSQSQYKYDDLISSNFLFIRNAKKVIIKNKVKNALIFVDNNQPKNADISSFLLKKMNGIFIFDHHVDSFLLSKPTFKFINSHFSSASEIIALFLQKQEQQKKSAIFPPVIFRLLLLGILIDTNNLQNNIGRQTIKCVNFLSQKGVNLSLAIDQMNNYKKAFIAQKIESIIVEPQKIILKVFDKTIQRNMAAVFAEDYLLNKNLKVVFVVLYNHNEEIFLSARSKSGFNVGEICKKFGGGGSHNRAAAQINNKKVSYVVDEIKRLILQNKKKIK